MHALKTFTRGALVFTLIWSLHLFVNMFPCLLFYLVFPPPLSLVLEQTSAPGVLAPSVSLRAGPSHWDCHDSPSDACLPASGRRCWQWPVPITPGGIRADELGWLVGSHANWAAQRHVRCIADVFWHWLNIGLLLGPKSVLVDIKCDMHVCSQLILMWVGGGVDAGTTRGEKHGG